MPGPWHLIEAGVATEARFAGLTEAPAALAGEIAPLTVAKRVRVPFVVRETWMRAARTACMALSDSVSAAYDAGARPVVLGGECTIVAGSIPAAAAREPELVLVYFDAHGDFNTMATTPSHFVGGMCLAHVCGKHIGTLLWPGVRAFPEERVCLVGARELDPGEAINLDRSRVRRFPFSPSAADAPGLLAAVRRKPLWLHIDLDVVDPAEMFAVNFPVPGGVSFDTLSKVLGALQQVATVRGIELCGYDVRKDPEGALTRRIARSITPILA
jgi:arginase